MRPLDQMPAPSTNAFRVGVDIGGTFTDIIVVGTDGSLRQIKVPSTPGQFEQAIVRGLSQLLEQTDLAPSALTTVIHGTTVATNAILEGRGTATALLTTEGFRDVLELGRLRYPTLHDLTWEKPKPLVPRRHRYEVHERINAQGAIDQPLDLAQIRDLVDMIRSQGIQSLAICFLNSYINPQHEAQVADFVRAYAPDLHISASYEILPEIKEYERTSTTVVNAYIRPIVDTYLGNLTRELQALGIDCPLLIMQSTGGLVNAEAARAKPVQLVESGPAAGVTATCFLARKLDLPNVIAFDMGGTTAKASLIEMGKPFESPEYEVGGSMNTRRSLMKGSGYTIRVPSIDIAEVGAGGGSLFWLDAGGAPHVGPQSTGAMPGPACYGNGGTLPTLTDAAVVMGYLNPVALAGGTQPIDQQAAVEAIRTHVAAPLNLDVYAAAYGIYTIAIANMTGVIRAVSSERGRDPRDFVLMAFGGAGPLHAAEIARAFEIPKVIVPISPGLFSAIGLLVADIQYHAIRSNTNRSALDAAALMATFGEMEAQTVAELAASGHHVTEVIFERFVDMRYAGQSFELRIPLTTDALGSVAIDDLQRQFGQEYERTYGHQTPDQRVEIVNLRLRTTCLTPETRSVEVFAERHTFANAPDGSTRDAYFGPAIGLVPTPVISRWQLTAEPILGPLIIEDMDATTLVPPHARAERDVLGNIIIEVTS